MYYLAFPDSKQRFKTMGRAVKGKEGPIHGAI
jgi:hypothetical protein